LKVDIQGRYFTKIQRNYLQDFANWAGYKLMGGRLSRHINLKIHLYHPNYYQKNCLYAETDYTDYGRKNPRNFIVTMASKFGLLKSLIILSHEMVHVKQFAIGELHWPEENLYPRWKGKKLDYDNISYWDLPYEIEAHGREKGLVFQWCDDKKLWKEPWYREIF